MANNEPTIKITAALDKKESVKQIRDVDIPAIANILNKEPLLKIKCTIDDSSIKNIKNQLSNLKISIGANVQPTVVKNTPVTETEIKINATSVKEQLAELKQTINANITGDAKEVMDGLVSQIKEGSTVWTTWLRGVNGQLKSFSISVKDATGEVNKYNYAINKLGDAEFLGSSGSTKGIEKVQKEIDTFVKQLSSMKRDVGSFTGIYAEIGEGADKTKVTFDSLANSIDNLKNGTKSVAEVRSEMTALKGAVDSVNGVLGNAQGKGFNKFENAEADARNFGITLEKIGLDLKKLNQSDSVVKDLSNRLKTVSIEANSLANVDEKNQEWANSYQKVNVELKSIQDAIKIVKQLEKQDKSSAAQKTLDNLNKIREAYKDIENYTKKNLSSSIGQSEKKSNSGYILNAKNQAEAAMKELAAEKLITSEVRAQLKEINKKHNKIMNGLDAKRKDIALTEEENQRTQRRNSILNTIENSLKKIGVLERESANDVEANSDIHKQQIESLTKQVSLNEKRLKTEKLLDDEAKKRIESAKEELNITRQLIQNRTTKKSQTRNETLRGSIAREINSSINSLSSRSANATFRNNANNAEVQEMIANIEALKSEYQSLSQQLQEDATPQSLVNIKKNLDQLAPKFTETINGANRLGEALRKSSANAKLANDIKNVSNAMDSYAQKNQKVVNSTKLMSDGITTFKDKWIELRRLASSNLDTEGLKKLNQEIKNFKQNADSAGLSGQSFFSSIKNGLGTLGIYFSAQQVVSTVTRYIGVAVDELKNMNDILTEISKTSDRTDESIKRLGEDAFDRANKYGRTASDYLLGVQEMSRAGFGEHQSEDLAELSLMAQAAGDMTAEMANQYIIATNAAYNLGGNEQKLNAILDSQNYITNRNALNMEHLAEATKLSASQASVSGVAIDQLTSAVGTMIATTQQGGGIAGRAFRGKRAYAQMPFIGESL